MGKEPVKTTKREDPPFFCALQVLIGEKFTFIAPKMAPFGWILSEKSLGQQLSREGMIDILVVGKEYPIALTPVMVFKGILFSASPKESARPVDKGELSEGEDGEGVGSSSTTFPILICVSKTPKLDFELIVGERE